MGWKRTVEKQGGGPRLGKLQIAGGGSQPTPCPLWATSAGMPPCVSPDLLRHVSQEEADKPNTCQILAVHFGQYMDLVDKLKAQSLDLEQFTGSTLGGQGQETNRNISLLTAVDFLSRELLPVNADSVYVQTPCGRFLISPSRWVEALAVLKPSIAVVPQPRTSAASAKKRCRKCVDYGLPFLQKSLAALEAESVEKGDKRVTDQVDIWAMIAGGPGEKERKYFVRDLAKLVAEREEAGATANVSGFLMPDFGTGETADARMGAIAASIEGLPEHLPRATQGIDDPIDILRAVEAGVDVVGLTALFADGEKGRAIVLQVEEEQGVGYIDVTDDKFLTDWTPMTSSAVCSCYSCATYTSGYLHHLFHTKELLGSVMVTLHNMHQYARFFARIRQETAAGTFAEYKAKFEAAWNNVAIR